MCMKQNLEKDYLSLLIEGFLPKRKKGWSTQTYTLTPPFVAFSCIIITISNTIPKSLSLSLHLIIKLIPSPFLSHRHSLVTCLIM